MIKLKLIDEWMNAWKLSSVWIFASIASFPTIWEEVSKAGVYDQLPPEVGTCLRILAAIGIASRIIKQQSFNKG